MTEEEKRDYLRKNFIQPLTDNLTQELNNLNMTFETSTENFANMINFNLGNLNDDIEIDEPVVNGFVEADLGDDTFQIELRSRDAKRKPKNTFFKFDERIEFNIEKFLSNRLNKLDKLETLLEETVRISNNTFSILYFIKITRRSY
jgi:hypothetical protein